MNQHGALHSCAELLGSSACPSSAATLFHALIATAALRELFSIMLPSSVHRQWARDYLDRAEQERVKSRKLGYLRLAVANSIRAQALEAAAEDNRSPSEQSNNRAMRR